MYTCNYCRFVVPAGRDEVRYCPRCGTRIERPRAVPPPVGRGPADDSTRLGRYRGKQINLGQLARHQRWAIWIISAQILMLLLMFAPPYLASATWLRVSWMFLVLPAAYIVTWTLTIAAIVVLEVDLRNNPVMILALAICALAPCVNLILVAVVNGHAVRALRRSGVKVGFFGARQDAVRLAVIPNICRGCGYNLTGNISGFCPECGATVAPR